MGEYAYDFTGENVHDGPSRNPHDTTRMTGGSSGGSGGAVAGGMVPFALGSDTNGSIRVPSSLCGIFGLKPTYGRLTRAGTFPFVFSLDHLGPFARSVRDLALTYDAMQGPAEGDGACAERPVEPVTQELDRGISGLRIATAGGYFRKGAFPEAIEALDGVAKALGAKERVEFPEAARARAAAYLITATEGAALHLDRLTVACRRFRSGRSRPSACRCDGPVRAGREGADLSPLVSRTCPRAVRARRCDPCASDSVYSPDDRSATFILDGQELPVRPNLGIYTQPISFIGLPVVAVPVPLKPLPIGVQIIAPPWREDIALRVASALEQIGIVAAARPTARRSRINGDQSPHAHCTEFGRELARAHVMSMTYVAETASGSLPRRTRAEELRLQLADEILRGGFAPGTALDETALARRFNVSRTPVREAIRMLTASGLVEVRAHRAAVVARPSAQHLATCLR